MALRLNDVSELPASLQDQARKKMGQLCTAAAAMKYQDRKSVV